MNSQQMTIFETLQKAIAFHKANKLQDAERLYRAILQVQPNHPGANHNIGVLAAQVGKPKVGLPYLKRALEINPSCHQFWITYVDKLVKTKQIDDALIMLGHAKSSGIPYEVINKLERIISRSKENLSLHSSTVKNLNENECLLKDKRTMIDCIVQQFSFGFYEKTEKISREYIRQYPRDVFGYKVLGLIMIRYGKYEEAIRIFEKSLNYSVDDPDVYNGLAVALEKLGDLDNALLNCTKAFDLNPNCAEVCSNMGNLFRELGRLEEALLYCIKALELNSCSAEAYNNKGLVLQNLGRFDEAISDYKKAVKIKPDFVKVYNNIGSALQSVRRFDEALLYYEKALEINPNYAEVYNNKGVTLYDLGRFDEALLNYEMALKIKQDYAEAYYNAADIKKYRYNDNVLSELSNIISSPKYKINEKMYAHFALGNLYNKNKNYHDAFINFNLGHRLRNEINKKGGSLYRHDLVLKKLSLFKELFTPQFFKDRSHWGLSAHTPIFIVGFPRSGTSLVEQILSSHSSVYGAGELEYISQFVSFFVDFQNIKTQEEFLRLIDHDKILEFSNMYLDKINTISNGSIYVTDKFPHNFQHLWFISLLFKNVKILHCKRIAEDTCLSCYFKKFTKGHLYIDDMQDLAKHYKSYLKTIELWKSVLPVTIHDISYEELVNNPENEIQNLLSICNLDFEEQCIEFYKTNRPVKTASGIQVREKMYTSSVGKWKKYEQFIGPLLEELYKNE